ncbi:hypothetical protein EX30DRAFT_138100 [Ascodesmis nigricans]|uniref:Uncharacterized protein n=1 Tax=Ascodesmis nigricans TaxID=341454 RepID=A0A4S2N181_9PEZI|nr:hypothetical protein EX30DRAFT_138100 [Ascodesmis nigricans]
MSWIYNAIVGGGPQNVRIGGSSTPGPDALQHLPPAYDGILDKKQPVIMPLRLPSLDHLRGKRVVLASASPRRKDLLAHFPRSLVSQTSKSHPRRSKKISTNSFIRRMNTSWLPLRRNAKTFTREQLRRSLNRPSLSRPIPSLSPRSARSSRNRRRL